MKIVATIEVQLGALDEENASHHKALEHLHNHPEEMIEWVYDAIDGGDNFGIHSPHLEDGDI